MICFEAKRDRELRALRSRSREAEESRRSGVRKGGAQSGSQSLYIPNLRVDVDGLRARRCECVESTSCPFPTPSLCKQQVQASPTRDTCTDPSDFTVSAEEPTNAPAAGEEESTATFEPVVRLSETVQVKTHEEDEEALFKM